MRHNRQNLFRSNSRPLIVAHHQGAVVSEFAPAWVPASHDRGAGSVYNPHAPSGVVLAPRRRADVRSADVCCQGVKGLEPAPNAGFYLSTNGVVTSPPSQPNC